MKTGFLCMRSEFPDSLSFLKPYFFQASTPFFLADENFDILSVNPAFEALIRNFYPDGINLRSLPFTLSPESLFEMRQALKNHHSFQTRIAVEEKNLTLGLEIHPLKPQESKLFLLGSLSLPHGAENLLKVLMENPLCGIFFYREKILYANPAFCEMSGYSLVGLLSLTPSHLFAAEEKEEREWFFSLNRPQPENESLFRELRLRCGSEEEKWVYAARSSAFYEGLPVGAVFVMDMTPVKFLQTQMEKLAITDSLTGAYNRVALEDRIREEVKRSELYEKPLSLIFFEIDFFKDVNDSFGHEAGDRTLIELSRIVQKNIRPMDFFARYGGAEFAILTPDADVVSAIGIAERIRREVEQTLIDIVGRVTITCGVSQFKEYDPADSEGVIVKMAMDALYRARRQGGNRVLAW